MILSNLLWANLHAQLLDNFNDGNFSSNPSWLGDTSRFAVSNGELQLKDLNPSGSNTSYLYVVAPTALQDSTTWEFFVRLQFATSTTNFARIYLVASNPDLSADQNGYFLRIGGISGNTDAIELFRQDGSNTTLLLSGTAGAVGGDPVLARVRVVRTAAGQWQLFADYSGGDTFQAEGTAVDVTYNLGAYFGFYCRYTSTRSEAFFFDDVRVSPLFEDRTPPVLSSAAAISETIVEATFDEPLATSIANNKDLYSIDKGIGTPINATLSAPNKVVLQLSNPLLNGQLYKLTVGAVQDLSGNTATTQTTDFVFYNIQAAVPGDIVITEIFADPTPAVGLPVVEWIELYNRSDKVIQLEGLGFSSGGFPQKLSPFLLLPGKYVILCDLSDLPDFTTFGDVVTVATFPSLTNSGDELILTDPEGALLASLFYEDTWYQDDEKAGGGWSLEIIDFNRGYDCAANWRASINPKGGTPGQENSVKGLPNEASLELLRAIMQSPTTLLLEFNQSLNSTTASDPQNYVFEGGNIRISQIDQPLDRQVLLELAEPIEPGQVYRVILNFEITDCFGNPIGISNSLIFGLAEPIAPGDLIINEVLYEPAIGGKRFIEFFNISNKVLNIKNLQIINAQKSTSTGSEQISTDFLLAPGDYVVVTESPEDIQSRYTVLEPRNLLKNAVPTLDSDQGNVTIRFDGLTIDSFDYNKDLHFALLTQTRAVSLERLNPQAPTQLSSSWHSAAASAGYATPTYRNSQYSEPTGSLNQRIRIANKRFSPDNDGFEDFLLIDYQLERIGQTATIRIFDANGRLVKQLVQNELLAANGSFKWDGDTDNGEKARIGIYIIWIELFSPDGAVARIKETCVFAGKLK